MKCERIKEWVLGPSGDRFIICTLTIAYLYFLIILNRWVVTDLGLRSYSRVWQFYVNYGDIGFVRRALLGSMLTLFKINTLFSNEYVFAYVFTAILGMFGTILTYYMLRGQLFSRATTIGIAFSPSFLAHFGYSTGTFDLMLFVLLLLIVVSINSLTVVLSLIAIGLLSHELFLFYVPFISVIYFASLPNGLACKKLFLSMCILVFSISIIIIIKLFGVSSFDETQYLSMMAAKMPNAAYKYTFWSGYFELFSTLSDNIIHGKAVLGSLLTPTGIFALIPVVYVLFLVYTCLNKNVKIDTTLRVLFAVALIFPFTAIFVAADFLRWVCMSANICLVAIGMLVRRGYLNVEPRVSLIMITFCVFSPFGASDIEWPFPLHQFVFAKLLHLLK